MGKLKYVTKIPDKAIEKTTNTSYDCEISIREFTNLRANWFVIIHD